MLNSTVRMLIINSVNAYPLKLVVLAKCCGAGLAFDGTFDGVQFNAGNEKLNSKQLMVYGCLGASKGMATKD